MMMSRERGAEGEGTGGCGPGFAGLSSLPTLGNQDTREWPLGPHFTDGNVVAGRRTAAESQVMGKHEVEVMGPPSKSYFRDIRGPPTLVWALAV